MADLHYFAFLPGDWLASEAVTMMTPEQEGAYVRLLCYQWQSSDLPCSIPSDDARLAHLSRLGKRWAKVGALVRAQFEEVPDDPTRLRNVKLWNVFDEASAKHAARVNAGQKGGTAKAKRKQPGSKPVADDKQSGSNATAMLEQSSSNGLASKNKSQNQSNKNTNTAAFDAAWAKYPRRAGGNPRRDALAAWQARLAAGVPAAELEAGVERYAAYIAATGREGTEFVKQASTFFGPSEHWRESWDPPAGAKPKTVMVIQDGWYVDVPA